MFGLVAHQGKSLELVVWPLSLCAVSSNFVSVIHLFLM